MIVNVIIYTRGLHHVCAVRSSPPQQTDHDIHKNTTVLANNACSNASPPSLRYGNERQTQASKQKANQQRVVPPLVEMSLLIKLCGSGSASASCGRRSLVQQAASSARRPKPASVFPAVSTPVASSRLVFTKGLPRIAVGGSCLQPPQHVLCHSNNRTVVARSPILSRQVAQLSGISGCPLAPRAVAARYSVSRYRRDGSGEELLGAGWQLPLPPLQLSLPQVLHQQRRSMMSEGAKGGGAQSEGAGNAPLNRTPAISPNPDF